MRHPIALCLYAAAMGILEAIVVVYLRRIYYPAGFGFPLVAMDPAILRAEIVREGMTLVMIGAVAWIAADHPWHRLLAFLVAFGIWDILYYAGLKLFLDWPASWLEPDILFLIPRVWVGPVLAPLLVSLAWAVGGLLLRRTPYERLGMGRLSWAAAMIGAALILAAFLLPGNGSVDGIGDATRARRGDRSAPDCPARAGRRIPVSPLRAQLVPRFSWILFGAGYLLGVGTLVRLAVRSRRLDRAERTGAGDENGSAGEDSIPARRVWHDVRPVATDPASSSSPRPWEGDRSSC